MFGCCDWVGITWPVKMLTASRLAARCSRLISPSVVLLCFFACSSARTPGCSLSWSSLREWSTRRATAGSANRCVWCCNDFDAWCLVLSPWCVARVACLISSVEIRVLPLRVRSVVVFPVEAFPKWLITSMIGSMFAYIWPMSCCLFRSLFIVSNSCLVSGTRSRFMTDCHFSGAKKFKCPIIRPCGPIRMVSVSDWGMMW